MRPLLDQYAMIAVVILGLVSSVMLQVIWLAPKVSLLIKVDMFTSRIRHLTTFRSLIWRGTF